MHILFLFLDGVGIGEPDPGKNPFLNSSTPTLDNLLGGRKIQSNLGSYQSDICSFIGIDAQLGVKGIPQSATGQATLITGLNIPQIVGQHYGPKPNPPIIEILNRHSEPGNNSDSGTLFSRALKMGKSVEFVNAYPDSYFAAITSGKRNYSVFPLSAVNAGIPLRDEKDLREGCSLSADFTGIGWREHLHITDIPIISPFEAGKRLAKITEENDLVFFEYWETDYAGHKQDMTAAIKIIEKLDTVIAGLTATLDLENTLIIITSDHGNMEDLSTRRHTLNKVPAMLSGKKQYFQTFKETVHSLCDITPFMLKHVW